MENELREGLEGVRREVGEGVKVLKTKTLSNSFKRIQEYLHQGT